MSRDFERWLEEMQKCVNAYKHASATSLIDAAIPYNLGWDPDRAARAILGLNLKDRYTLETHESEKQCHLSNKS